jgi:hypothetical protein
MPRRRSPGDPLAGLIYRAALFAIIAYVFDPPIRRLLATSGAVAIILGPALRSTSSDVFSGVVLNFSRPYRPGDWSSTISGLDLGGDLGLLLVRRRLALESLGHREQDAIRLSTPLGQMARCPPKEFRLPTEFVRMCHGARVLSTGQPPINRSAVVALDPLQPRACPIAAGAFLEDAQVLGTPSLLRLLRRAGKGVKD